MPYPDGLHDAFADAMKLRTGARLLDVGCGPGIVALTLADLFTDVVGVDADAEMLAEARSRADALGVTNARWVPRLAEAMAEDLGRFECATFGQSFHWMDRERVARVVFGLLEPGGALVHVDTVVDDPAAAAPASLPFPTPPRDAMKQLRERYLGAEQRAGQGVIRHGTPDDEWSAIEPAGFRPPERVRVQGRKQILRTVDDLVAEVLSNSSTAPHLFGDRLDDFERELRALLESAADEGRFSAWQGDIDLVVYRRP
jgi:ubiquinone/menaquinone biosynthesis C-methylase UbiE